MAYQYCACTVQYCTCAACVVKLRAGFGCLYCNIPIVRAWPFGPSSLAENILSNTCSYQVRNMFLHAQRFQPGACSSSGASEPRWQQDHQQPLRQQLCRQHRHRPAAQRGQRARALAAVVDTAGADVQTLLLQWLGQKGVNTDKLPVTPVAQAADETGKLVLRCKRNLSRSEKCFAVPDGAWITPQVVKKSAIGSLVQQLDAWLQIALFLLYERQQGPASSWRGYISSLPAQVDTPLSWSKNDLAALQGSQLESSLQGYR